MAGFRYFATMRHHGILFDFDFTLADPRGWLIPTWNEALDAIGLTPVSPSAILPLVGKPLSEQYSQIVGEKPAGPKFQKFERKYTEYRDCHAVSGTGIFAGVREIAELFTKLDYQLGIVSTGASRRLRSILEHYDLQRYFSALEAGCADKSTGIFSAMITLRLEASEVTYVGDHPEDQKAAQRSSVHFIGVMSGMYMPVDFEPGTTVISSIADLPSVLIH